MKAKVIKTGEIVNVVPTEGGWVADFGVHIRHYTVPELDFEFVAPKMPSDSWKIKIINYQEK